MTTEGPVLDVLVTNVGPDTYRFVVTNVGPVAGVTNVGLVPAVLGSPM